MKPDEDCTHEFVANEESKSKVAKPKQVKIEYKDVVLLFTLPEVLNADTKEHLQQEFTYRHDDYFKKERLENINKV